ncbi:hypothetical protein GYMLUDRAFT_39587 [Collybiopsis luxurians FD-317 M1]|nr:hypothetical protein GYMLUDRAFT_39587 [Collybiopsis luxurians FD-317 M1]
MTCTGNPIPPMSPRSASEASNSSSSTSASSSSSSSSASYRIPLKIRDFTYAAPDPRHQGLGEDGRGTLNVPRANRVRVIYKVLLDEAGYRAWKAAAVGSDRDSPDSDETDVDEDAEGDQDDDDDAAHWPLAHWPSAGEADAEFDDDDDEEEEENESGPLSPGLYRALYAFEPEGSREMALQEQQIVRVVGRGGGVGWAVVVVDGVDEQGKKRMSQKDRQLALVPEGYLEPIALDEDETS